MCCVIRRDFWNGVCFLVICFWNKKPTHRITWFRRNGFWARFSHLLCRAPRQITARKAPYCGRPQGTEMLGLRALVPVLSPEFNHGTKVQYNNYRHIYSAKNHIYVYGPLYLHHVSWRHNHEYIARLLIITHCSWYTIMLIKGTVLQTLTRLIRSSGDCLELTHVCI